MTPQISVLTKYIIGAYMRYYKVFTEYIANRYAYRLWTSSRNHLSLSQVRARRPGPTYAEAIEIVEMEPWKFIAQGDDLATWGRQRFRRLATGADWESEFAHTITLRGGPLVALSGLREFRPRPARLHPMTDGQRCAPRRRVPSGRSRRYSSYTSWSAKRVSASIFTNILLSIVRIGYGHRGLAPRTLTDVTRPTRPVRGVHGAW